MRVTSVRENVVQMKDPARLRGRWEGMSRYTKFDKVYLETSRDMIVADQASVGDDGVNSKLINCL
jgi:hypothetical protein